MVSDVPTITVYPVGILWDLLHLRVRLPRQPRGHRWRFLRAVVRQMLRQARRRSYWNGYLAEVNYPPAGIITTRCGSGWTKRRAARDLGLQLWLDNDPFINEEKADLILWIDATRKEQEMES